MTSRCDLLGRIATIALLPLTVVVATGILILSSPLSAGAQTLSPPAYVVAQPSSGSVIVRWSAVSGAASYQIKYQDVTAGASASTQNTTVDPTTLNGLTNGDSYTFTVAAKPSGGSFGSPSSPAATATPSTTAPSLSAPQYVVAIPASGSVTVNWSTVSGATWYAVQQGTASNATIPITIVSGTTFTDTSVTNGTTYYYKILAINSSGASAPSNAVSATPPGTGVVGPPQDLLSEGQDGIEHVTWEAVTGAGNYDVYRSTSSSIDPSNPSQCPVPYAMSGTNSYDDGAITANQDYWYSVAAVNAAGEGPRAASIHVVAGAIVVNPPSNVTAIGRTSCVKLSWTAPTVGSTPDSYAVYRGLNSGNVSLLQDGITATNWTDSSVTNGTHYYYRVVSVYQGVHSTEQFTDAIPIGTSTLTTTITTSGTGASLTWTAGAGAATYMIYRSATTPVDTTNSANFITGPITATTYTDSTGVGGTAYYYAVVGYNGVNYSDPSNSANVVIKPAAPTNVVALSDDQTITLNWTPSTSVVDGYNVYRGLTSLTESAPALNDPVLITNPTYEDSGLTDGQAYYYFVTAMRNGIESVPSNESWAIPTTDPPVITSGPNADPDVISGTTTSLSVTATDDLGASSLTYTWSVLGTPPAPVTFSPNGTNAANNSTATFTAPGIYNIEITVRDTNGAGAVDSLSVDVVATPTTITISPKPATVYLGTVQAFTATETDQFGLALAVQPQILDWTAASGTIGPDGTYTPPAGTGTDIVTVSDDDLGLTDTCPVTIIDPTVQNGALGAPTSVTTALEGSPLNRVLVSWGWSTGATGYTIERSQTSGSGFKAVGTVSGSSNSFEDAALPNGTYYYIVFATATGQTSAKSNQATATISAGPSSPTSLTIVKMRDGQVTCPRFMYQSES